MAHFQQLEFVRIVKAGLPDYFSNKKVLEIGSWDVNGSVRNNFTNCDYLGVDIAEGAGVDLVAKGEGLSIAADTFDVVISCECFEHNPEWAKTFHNMIRMLRPGGLCIVTCATLGRSEHGTERTNADASLTALNHFPDYYRNLVPKDFKKDIELDVCFHPYQFFLNIYSRDLYFIGIKKSEQKPVESFSPELLVQIKSIRREKPLSFISALNYNIKFGYRYALASVLGEKNYHHFKHYLSKKKRGLRSKSKTQQL